jgi:leucyl-tRNA synthetase
VWAAIATPALRGGRGGPATLKELRRAVHQAIAKVSDHLEGFRFNTAVAELMTLQNAMTKAKAAGAAGSPEWPRLRGHDAAAGADRAAPGRGAVARAGNATSVHLQAWPEADPEALARDEVVIAVQVGGKLRGEVTVPADAGKEDVLAAAKASPNVRRHLEGMTVVREIVVPGKLVNLVVKPQG